MTELEILMEQYKSVRQESLDAGVRQHAVVQYGLASVGVAAGLGIARGSDEPTLAALILMALVPVLVMFVTAMAAMHASRVTGARQFLISIEQQVQTVAAPIGGSPVLEWEIARKNRARTRVDAYPFAFAAAIAGTTLLGPGIGGYLLASNGLWLGFAVGIALDLAALGYFSLWAIETYDRLARAAYDERGGRLRQRLSRWRKRSRSQLPMTDERLG
jgi:MFS family permease